MAKVKKQKIIKVFSILLLNANLILAGCASPGKAMITQTDKDLFAQGLARLNCRLSCAWGMVKNYRKLAMLDASEDWQQLADNILLYDYSEDLTYYYLGRAAEGLGYYDAALKYYIESGTTGAHCPQKSDFCNGLIFPDAAIARIAIVKERKRLQSESLNQSKSSAASNFYKGDTDTTSSDRSYPSSVINEKTAPNDEWATPPTKLGSDDFKIISQPSNINKDHLKDPIKSSTQLLEGSHSYQMCIKRVIAKTCQDTELRRCDQSNADSIICRRVPFQSRLTACFLSLMDAFNKEGPGKPTRPENPIGDFLGNWHLSKDLSDAARQCQQESINQR